VNGDAFERVLRAARRRERTREKLVIMLTNEVGAEDPGPLPREVVVSDRGGLVIVERYERAPGDEPA